MRDAARYEGINDRRMLEKCSVLLKTSLGMGEKSRLSCYPRNCSSDKGWDLLMSLVDIAPWPRKRLSREKKFEFNLVENLIDRACWRCGKYLGSMLYFDFGEKK